jgi:outer membrane protein assembly factor BamD (BamD/ComL family)
MRRKCTRKAAKSYAELQSQEPDKFLLNQIVSHLATAERELGEYQAALAHMQIWKQSSPTPEEVEKRIYELRQQMAADEGAKHRDGAGSQQR